MKKIFLLLMILTLGADMGQAQDNVNKHQEGLATATFAGGCFWCMEPPFEKIDGVRAVVSGYTGGTQKDPTYQEVSSGATGHIEAVQVIYEPDKVNYNQLLAIFWRNIDPTQENGQFADKGAQYRTAIFYHDENQKNLAQESKAKLQKDGPFKEKIVTEILPATPFYAAEDYHQDYYKKNPTHYKQYRYFSGRQPFIEKIWGKE